MEERDEDTEKANSHALTQPQIPQLPTTYAMADPIHSTHATTRLTRTSILDAALISDSFRTDIFGVDENCSDIC
jgi:hypothetical protein